MHSTPRNLIQETAFSVQFVPGMRFLVCEFAVYLRVDVVGRSLGPGGRGGGRGRERELDADPPYAVGGGAGETELAYAMSVPDRRRSIRYVSTGHEQHHTLCQYRTSVAAYTASVPDMRSACAMSVTEMGSCEGGEESSSPAPQGLEQGARGRAQRREQ
eukprot:3941973-Rhodomonas_salina.4